MPEIVLSLDIPQLLNLLLAVVFPVTVGLVTTQVTSSTMKAVLLATISLASGLVSALLTAVLAGAPFDLVAALLTGLAAWIIAIATHLGFWKPSGVTEKVQGFGSPPLPDEKRLITKADMVRVTMNVHPQAGMSEETIGRIASNQLDRAMRSASIPIQKSGNIEVSGLTASEIEADYQAEQSRRENGILRRDLKGE